MPCEGLRALEWHRDPRNSQCCTSERVEEETAEATGPAHSAQPLRRARGTKRTRVGDTRCECDVWCVGAPPSVQGFVHVSIGTLVSTDPVLVIASGASTGGVRQVLRLPAREAGSR